MIILALDWVEIFEMLWDLAISVITWVSLGLEFLTKEHTYSTNSEWLNTVLASGLGFEENSLEFSFIDLFSSGFIVTLLGLYIFKLFTPGA